MTGNSRRLFTSPASPLSAMVLVATETAWIAMVIAALANTYPHFSMRVPVLCVALPGVVMAALTRGARELRGPFILRMIALGVVTLVVGACSAGWLASTSVAGAFGAVAFHPWTVVGRVPSATSTIAWFAASVSVARGVWLGFAHASFRQVGRSALVTGAAYLTLFIVAATNHEPALHRAVASAGWLFVVTFFVLFALGYVMRVREADEEGVGAGAIGDSPAWTVILGATLAAIVGIGILAGLVLGHFGSGIGRVLRDSGIGIADAVDAVVRAFAYVLVHVVYGIGWVIGKIIGLFGHYHLKTSKQAATTTTTTPQKAPNIGQIPPLFAGILGALAILGALGLIRHYRPRRRRAPVVRTNEIRYSEFTWGRLFGQFFRLIGRLFSRFFGRLWRRKRRSGRAEADLVGVRADYQRVLETAASKGAGRQSGETAREFTERLAVGLGEFEMPLRELTVRYERVRYGGEADAETGTEEELERLLVALLEALEVSETDPASLVGTSE